MGCDGKQGQILVAGGFGVGPDGSSSETVKLDIDLDCHTLNLTGLCGVATTAACDHPRGGGATDGRDTHVSGPSTSTGVGAPELLKM